MNIFCKWTNVEPTKQTLAPQWPIIAPSIPTHDDDWEFYNDRTSEIGMYYLHG